MNDSRRDQKSLFIDSSFCQNLRVAFWVVYIVLPIFTGWLAYDWLPNESFDEKRHDLLAAHEVGDRWGDYGERPDIWRHKSTGDIYTPASFAVHRNSEARRLAATWFVYGLIGCFFFAYIRVAKKQSSFFEAFGKAVLLNLAVAIYTFISMSK